jgi:hypothetical protein
MNPGDDLDEALDLAETKKQSRLTVPKKGSSGLSPALVKAHAAKKAKAEAKLLQAAAEIEAKAEAKLLQDAAEIEAKAEAKLLQAAAEIEAKKANRKVYQRKYTDEQLVEFRREQGRKAAALGRAARSGSAALKKAAKLEARLARHEAALANKKPSKFGGDKEALSAWRKEHARQLGLSRKGIESKLAKVSSETNKVSLKLSKLEKLFPPFRVDYVGRPDQLVANGKHGRGYMSRLLARNPGEGGHKGRPKGSVNKPRESTNFGPYKFTLLKNPIVDFEVGGIKVLPALAGVAGTSLLTSLVGLVPQYKEMVNKKEWYANIIPGAVAIAVAAFGYSYAKKKNNKLAMQICSDIAAFGIYSAASGVMQEQVDKLVNSVTGPSVATTLTPATVTAPPAQKGMAGGQFFEMPALTGGAWMNQDQANQAARAEQMNGYLLKGQQTGYPSAFMTGSSGYPPVALYGGADDVGLKSIALSGGQFRSGFGHSMEDYAD